MSPGIWSQNLGGSSDTAEGHPIITGKNEGGTQPGAGGDPQGKWSQPSTQETQVTVPFFCQRSLWLGGLSGLLLCWETPTCAQHSPILLYSSHAPKEFSSAAPT